MNKALVIDSEHIRIDLPACNIHMQTHEMYEKIKKLYAEEDIRAYLLDEGYDENAIDSILTEVFIDRWLKAVSNNETIAEVKQMIAKDLAEEFFSEAAAHL